MMLFNNEDFVNSAELKASNWDPKPKRFARQLQKDFEKYPPKAEEVESHSDWEVLERRETGITHYDGEHVEGEILDITHPKFDWSMELIPDKFHKE